MKAVERCVIALVAGWCVGGVLFMAWAAGRMWPHP